MAREQWTTNLGFVLAAAGSAIGLGNIWRFPYLVGNEGGAAFILIYLFTIALIGYPLLATEIAIGRHSQKNPIGAFNSIAPNTPWWIVGGMSVLAAFVILSFYSIVAGWSLAYVFKSLGGFSANSDFTGLFLGHITSVWPPIIWHGIFMFLTISVIALGVVKGIQRVSKVLMPLLLVLLIALVVKGLSLEGASAGVAYLLTPDFSAIDGNTFLRAIGQSFFTLSLGMGAIITYGSYLKRQDNITSNAGWIVGLDTAVAIIAGFAIFPAVFALGFNPTDGVGLAFMTLPAVFSEMAGGTIFAFMFFLLLSVAALTSAISLLEVVVSWVIDEKGWTRRNASIIIGILVFLMGLFPTLGLSVLSHISFLGMDILDTYDFFTSDILLPLGGMLTALFAAHVWKTKNALDEINHPKGKIVFGNWYGILVGYIIPIAVAVVMVWGLYTKLFM